MKHLYFIRHGETDANAANKWPRLDARLTAKGRAQASEAGRQAKLQGIAADVIIASPLPRAQHTARLVASELGYPAESIDYWDLLVEREFGDLTDVFSDEFFDGTRTYEDTNDVPGVEHITALQERAAQALEALRALPHQTIIVVGHGIFGRALVRTIKGIPPEAEYATDRDANYIPNATIVRLI
jgi:broad specificity phosphatase PhoE